MNTKLTLHVDKEIIEQAKLFAREKQQSLSVLVEDYLRFILLRKQIPTSRNFSPTVQELSGIIHIDSVEELREEYTDYLIEKYK